MGTVPLVGLTADGKVVGIDFSGVVERVGPSVDNFKAGDRVYGFAQPMTEHGALSPFIMCDPGRCSKIPQAADFAQAASIPTASVTSLQALRDAACVKEGDKVLILGGSGGCGIAGVQIAASLGAEVTAVCSGANADLVRSMGAKRVIDYKVQTVSEALSGEGKTFDAVYDTVTSPEDKDYYSECSFLVKQGGTYVGINAHASDWLRYFGSRVSGIPLQKRGFKLIITNHLTAPQDLSTLSEMIEDGSLRAVLDTTFEFTGEGVCGAFERLKSRRTVGKIVVAMP